MLLGPLARIRDYTHLAQYCRCILAEQKGGNSRIDSGGGAQVQICGVSEDANATAFTCWKYQDMNLGPAS